MKNVVISKISIIPLLLFAFFFSAHVPASRTSELFTISSSCLAPTLSANETVSRDYSGWDFVTYFNQVDISEILSNPASLLEKVHSLSSSGERLLSDYYHYSKTLGTQFKMNFILSLYYAAFVLNDADAAAKYKAFTEFAHNGFEDLFAIVVGIHVRELALMLVLDKVSSRGFDAQAFVSELSMYVEKEEWESGRVNILRNLGSGLRELFWDQPMNEAELEIVAKFLRARDGIQEFDAQDFRALGRQAYFALTDYAASRAEPADARKHTLDPAQIPHLPVIASGESIDAFVNRARAELPLAYRDVLSPAFLVDVPGAHFASLCADHPELSTEYCVQQVRRADAQDLVDRGLPIKLAWEVNTPYHGRQIYLYQNGYWFGIKGAGITEQFDYQNVKRETNNSLVNSWGGALNVETRSGLNLAERAIDALSVSRSGAVARHTSEWVSLDDIPVGSPLLGNMLFARWDDRVQARDNALYGLPEGRGLYPVFYMPGANSSHTEPAIQLVFYGKAAPIRVTDMEIGSTFTPERTTAIYADLLGIDASRYTSAQVTEMYLLEFAKTMGRNALFKFTRGGVHAISEHAQNLQMSGEFVDFNDGTIKDKEKFRQTCSGVISSQMTTVGGARTMYDYDSNFLQPLSLQVSDLPDGFINKQVAAYAAEFIMAEPLLAAFTMLVSEQVKADFQNIFRWMLAQDDLSFLDSRFAQFVEQLKTGYDPASFTVEDLVSELFNTRISNRDLWGWINTFDLNDNYSFMLVCLICDIVVENENLFSRFMDIDVFFDMLRDYAFSTAA